MKRKIAALALCIALTLNICVGAFAPPYACAADCNAVYTFGDTNGPFRDLAEERRKEVERRERERRKEEARQVIREKAAMRKAAREAREREKKGRRGGVTE